MALGRDTAPREAAAKPRRPVAATGLAILEALAERPSGVGVSVIGRAIGFDIGQTHRILRALMADGWIEQVAPSGDYRLTGRLLAVAGRMLARLDLRGAALPVMEALQAETGETIHLAERRGDGLVCVARIVSGQSVVVTSQIGDTWPLAGTALGAAVRSVAFRPGVAVTTVDQEAKRAAAAGFSIDEGRYRADIHAVAAPILNLERVAVGALAISGPAARMDRARLADFGRLVRRAANRVSGALGFAAGDEAPVPPMESRKQGKRR